MIPIPNISLSNVATHPPQKTGKRRYLLRHLADDEYVLDMDHTTFSNYLECERKGMWNSVYSRTSHRGPALTYGSAMHKGLELYYQGEKDFARIAEAVEQEFVDTPAEIGNWRTADKCKNVLAKYIEKYSKEDTFKILANEGKPCVEQAFQMPLTTIEVNNYLAFPREELIEEEATPEKLLHVSKIHFVWTGVIDLIIEDNDRKWIVDHKTTSVEGPTYWKTFELSPQFIGYVWAAQKITGLEITGALANVIYGREEAKTDATRREHEKKMFLRQYFYYKPEQIEEWEKTTITHAENFCHNLITGSFPMHSHVCVGKYGTCPYHDVCSQPIAQRLTMLMSDQYATNTWNPLD